MTFYFMISCGAPTEKYIETMVVSMRGFTCGIPESKEAGIILRLGSNDAGDVKDTFFMQKHLKWEK